MKKLDLSQWLDKCPEPVIGRVIREEKYLTHLASCAHIYKPGMLVVVSVDALAAAVYPEDQRPEDKP